MFHDNPEESWPLAFGQDLERLACKPRDSPPVKTNVEEVQKLMAYTNSGVTNDNNKWFCGNYRRTNVCQTYPAMSE